MDITSYILSKKYIEDSLAGAGAVQGKSAYDIACDNGFKGTPAEWLESLKGLTPQIGPNGTWLIGDVDTGVIASPSLAGYATEDFVELMFNSVPKVDLTPYATRKELSEAILGIVIPDVSNFATRDEVDKAIASIVFPETDLSNYPTRKEVADAINAIPKPDLSPYATKDEVRNAIDAIPEVDLSPYAKKTDLPSTEGLASESYVQEQINNIDFPETDLTNYATKDFVQLKINEAQLQGKEVDLSNYYTKSEVDNKIDNIDIPQVDLSGLASEQFVRDEVAKIEIPSTEGLATEDYVTRAIEQIDIPSTEGLATQSYVDESIANIKHPSVDLTPYATKEQLEDYATEEFVNRLLNEVIGLAPDELNSLEELATAIKENESLMDALNSMVAGKADKTALAGLASEDLVRRLIAEAKLDSDTKVDLSDYASKQFVEDAIDEIIIPSIDGLATEEFVEEAIASIQVPDTTGLATENYVDEAIAAIQIPEAKPDINVYEITSESAVLDELVALLPEGVEIHSGDVMLVSNSMGVKSAYQFDEEWIACDGNVDASKVIMPFDITLAGSYERVGNLSKTSTGTATFATKGKSVAQALQEMLSKREQPSIKTQPKVTLTATSGAKEVGTEVTPTWSASLGAGEYTYGPATGVVAKTWAISDTDGHSASTASGSFAKFTVGDDTNYRITAKATYDDGAVAQDNLGDPSNPVVKIVAGNKSANGSYVTGYRAWFMYVGESLDAINSAFIRGTTNKGATPSTQSGVTIPAGTKRVMVAIPANGSNLTSVIDVDGMGLDVFGNFTKTNVDVEGLNGYKATSYDVWVADNENGLAATHYNLVIG